MLRQLPFAFAMLLSTAVLPRHALRAAEITPEQAAIATAQPLGQNAALSYWPAFSFIPVGESNEKLLGNWKQAPLDDSAKKLIEDGKNALYYLHLGAANRDCNWGLKLEEGMSLLLPHLGKGRDLARLACLRARMRFEAGDGAGASEDIADVLTMARHLGSDDILIILLVQINIEQMALDTAWPYVKRLDVATLRHLQSRLAALAPGVSLKRCIGTWERYSGPQWLIARIQKSANDPAWIEHALGPMTLPKEEVEAAVKAAGGTPQAMIASLQKLDPYFAELAAATDLPPDQAPKRLDEIASRLQEIPLGKNMVSHVGTIYQKTVGAAAQMELFKSDVAAALATQNR